MNLPFLKKKKDINILNIHGRQYSPRHDWAVMLILLFVCTVLVAVYSTFLSLGLLKSDNIIPREIFSTEDRPKIDEAAVLRAVEFINSRKGD